MNKGLERLHNGLVTENPTFVMMLGMCPTLAVTTSAINGIGMGLTTTVILTLSNIMISLLRKIIPDRVRIPAYIVVVATFVTIVQFLLEAYIPSLNKSLGLYIPLIVVNCIILGRAESYASKNGPFLSMMDGIGMGLGFTVGLTSIGIFREWLGNGTIFGFTAMPSFYTPISIFVLAPGAFFVLAFLVAFLNYRNIKKARKAGCEPQLVTAEDCANCGFASSCSGHTEAVLDAATLAAANAAGAKVKAAAKATKEAADKATAGNAAPAAKQAANTEAKPAAPKADSAPAAKADSQKGGE